MAEPKLEIERRCDRIELAISTLVTHLVLNDPAFSANDADNIERILKGKVL